MTSATTSSGGGYVVQLAIYDLSMGMARQLSSQFLGPAHAIDVIPHCGVVIYDLEYFYGQGIQHAPPHLFRSQRGIHPVRTITVGRTDISKRDFDAWCRNVASREYSPTSYDLLTRNCNNFADYALREGLGMEDGVPHWVLDVPRRFLESPMGQMFRPMLEDMTAPVDGFDHEDGTFGGGGGSGNGGGSNVGAQVVANGAVAGGRNPWAAAAAPKPEVSTDGTSAPAGGNPWADIPSATTSAPAPSPGEVATPAPVAAAPAAAAGGTPLLDSHGRPLLSPDASAVPACVRKLSGGAAVASLAAGDEDDHGASSSTSARGALERLGGELTSGPPDPTAETVGASLLPILRYLLGGGGGGDGKGWAEDEVAKRGRATELAFALMLLRLVVLHRGDGSSDPGGPTSECLYLVMKGLAEESNGEGAAAGPLTGATARSMAWCVCGNAFAQPQLLAPVLAGDGGGVGGGAANPPTAERLVEAALGDLNGPVPAPVRQAASAFLYNLALHLGTEAAADAGDDDDVIPDVVVALLCGTLEGLDGEGDATARFRRLLAVGKVLGGYRSAGAASLASDLGYGEVIGAIADGGGDDGECRRLAGEVRSVMLR